LLLICKINLNASPIGDSSIRDTSAMTSDNPFYKNALAYQTTAALVAAVKLDIFSLIGAGSNTADLLSSATSASVRGLRILCDYLTVIGLLNKQESTYVLTPPAKRYLDSSSSAALASSIDFFAAPEMISLLLNDPVSYVRNGGAVGLGNLSPDNPIWVRFAKAVAPFAAPTAKRVAFYVSGLKERPNTILDVAAGHGLYGIEVARVCAEAFVTAVDWEGVLTVARANAERAGINDRYQTVPGSAFDVDWGHGFDLVLVPNFLHHFSRGQCVALLRKVKNSLSSNGRVLIIEFVPNEDRVSPPLQATFAFWMLASTPGGDAYTIDELESMAADAGFARTTARALLPTPQTLVVLQN
jgi:ubiquinone/menaquinone biosynthesis C-methylase UbiE